MRKERPMRTLPSGVHSTRSQVNQIRLSARIRIFGERLASLPMAANLWRISVVLLLSVVASFPVISAPQQSSASTTGSLQLTLKEAVQLALEQNPQRVIAQLLVSESDRNSQIARSALLPQASIAASGSLNQYNIQSIERSQERKAAGPFQLVEAGPTFSQTILNLPVIRGYQIGQEGTREARADEQTTRETVVNAVVNQYLLILRALATRDAANARVALAQRLYDQATELQKTGIGLNIDTVRANVELQNERQNLIDAETQTRTTKYGLAELLDLPSEQDLEVADRLDFYDLPVLEKEALLNQALTSRPEIRSLNSQQRIAKLTTDSAREQRLPHDRAGKAGRSARRIDIECSQQQRLHQSLVQHALAGDGVTHKPGRRRPDQRHQRQIVAQARVRHPSRGIEHP